MAGEESGPALTAEGLHELAKTAAGSHDRAVTLLQRALKLDPSAADTCIALGRAYRIKGWLQEELELWQQRTRLDGSDANAKEKIGWILWFTGRPNEALPWLEAALAQRPDDSWTYFFQGNAFLALARFGNARQRYGRALELEPDHSSAQAGLIWSMLAAHQDEEAYTQLRAFHSSAYDGDRYALKIADIEFFLGEEEAARTHALEALAEPDERYWPRGILASTILGALLWSADRGAAESYLATSGRIDAERLRGGDQGFMPHFDLAAVAAIQCDAAASAASLRSAMAAGWRYGSIATRDPLFKGVRSDHEFAAVLDSA